MIIFLYGADSYRSRQKLGEIVGHYKSLRKSGLNLLYVDAVEVGFLDFYNQFKISPMFAEKKLVVVKNVFGSKQFQEDFLQELKALEAMQDVVVVYESKECDQRLKLFKQLIRQCKCQEFTALDAKQTISWAQKEFEKHGQKVTIDALGLLVSCVGNDLWRLSNEIEKMANYKKGMVIKKDDVELMVKPSIEVDIFKTIDALAQKNKHQALQLLHKHLDAGEAPLYLLSMIAYQFKNLLIVKELAEKGLMYDSIIKKSGLHPFVVKKNYFACSQFSFAELKTIYHNIYETDLNIKTGKVEPETALDLLVSHI